MSRDRKKTPGEAAAARQRHLVRAGNSENLRKIRAGEEACLQVSGRLYRVRPPGNAYYPALLCVVALRPGHWVVDYVVDKDGLHVYGNGKHIQYGDILAEVVEDLGIAPQADLAPPRDIAQP